MLITINSNPPDVLIGFNEDFYSVNESSGPLTLVIEVLVGQLSDEVEIQLNTQDITAQGEITIL